MSYKLLIVGSRDFSDESELNRIMAALTSNERPSAVISGGAAGADQLGAKWALGVGLPVTVVEPDWKQYGRKAGFIRNRKMVEMLDAGDAVVCFYGPAGRSAGAGHTVDLARARGLRVRCFVQASWTPGDSSSEGHDAECGCAMCAVEVDPSAPAQAQVEADRLAALIEADRLAEEAAAEHECLASMDLVDVR